LFFWDNDIAGRVRLSRDAEGYEVEYDYDNIDRVTVVTYPDGTTEQGDYGSYLEAQAVKDRNVEGLRGSDLYS
jgi:YD repeat-containing protein